VRQDLLDKIRVINAHKVNKGTKPANGSFIVCLIKRERFRKGKLMMIKARFMSSGVGRMKLKYGAEYLHI
jgi:hypothetical protein